MWRGKDWKPMYPQSPSFVSDIHPSNNGTGSVLDGSGKSDSRIQRPDTEMEVSTRRLVSLWKLAIESNKALLVDGVELGPDALLEKVEAFEGISQATEHSYPALILSSEDNSSSKTNYEDGSDSETIDVVYDEDDFDVDGDGDGEDHVSDSFEEAESSFPLGSLPVDSIAERLNCDEMQ